MRHRRNTDEHEQRLRRALAADPTDDAVRAALIGALTRVGAWREIADLASEADRARRGLALTTIVVTHDAGSHRPTVYEVEHRSGPTSDQVLDLIAAAADRARTPIDDERGWNRSWTEILGVNDIRPALEQAGFRFVNEHGHDEERSVFVDGRLEPPSRTQYGTYYFPPATVCERCGLSIGMPDAPDTFTDDIIRYHAYGFSWRQAPEADGDADDAAHTWRGVCDACLRSSGYDYGPGLFDQLMVEGRGDGDYPTDRLEEIVRRR